EGMSGKCLSARISACEGPAPPWLSCAFTDTVPAGSAAFLCHCRGQCAVPDRESFFCKKELSALTSVISVLSFDLSTMDLYKVLCLSPFGNAVPVLINRVS